MAHRYCRKCGWGYSPEEWSESDFCINCGSSLWKPQNYPSQRETIEHINPYPDSRPASKPSNRVSGYIDNCRLFAATQPYLFGAGVAGFGVAAILVAPQLVVIAHAVMGFGIFLACVGMLGMFWADGEDAFKIMSAGTLIFLAGFALSLAAQMLIVGGIMAIATGGGVAIKATAEDAIRWRLRRQMRDKDIVELLRISRQMND